MSYKLLTPGLRFTAYGPRSLLRPSPKSTKPQPRTIRPIRATLAKNRMDSPSFLRASHLMMQALRCRIREFRLDRRFHIRPVKDKTRRIRRPPKGHRHIRCLVHLHQIPSPQEKRIVRTLRREIPQITRPIGKIPQSDPLHTRRGGRGFFSLFFFCRIRKMESSFDCKTFAISSACAARHASTSSLSIYVYI